MSLRNRMFLLLICAAVLLGACGSSETDTAAPDDSEVTETVEAADVDAAANATDDAATESAEAAGEETSEQAQPLGEPDIVVTATTVPAVEQVDEVEAVPTTADVAAVEQVEPVEQFVPAPGPGLGAFAVRLFETGELGLTETEQGCIDGRLVAELGFDRTTEFDTLDVPQQAKSIEILLDCADGGNLESLFLSEFEVTDELLELGIDADFGTCIFREISRDDEDQPLVLLAITSIVADQAAPAESVEAGSRTFARCFDIGALLVTAFTDQPEFSSLIDIACLETGLDEDASAAIFAGAFLDPEGDDAENTAAMFAAVRPCLRFGQLMADAFAGTVAFNAAEIACIDEAFNTDEIFEAVVSGGDLPDSAVEVMFGCLEPATVQALNGG